MKNPLKTYNFWFKIIGAALLIAFGLWIIFDEKMAVFMVLMFTGLVAGIFAIIRVIPLMRTMKTARGRIVSIVEILVHLCIAVVLIYGAISNLLQEENNMNALATFINEYYRFILALLFLTRVIAYFWCVVLFKEETDKIKFWVHIGLMVLACVMCSLTDVKSQTIALVIGVIALVCSLGLVVDGAVGYGRYRKMIKKERDDKKEEQIEEQEPVSKDAPTTTDEVIPMIDEEPTSDSAIVN